MTAARLLTINFLKLYEAQANTYATYALGIKNAKITIQRSPA